MADDRYQNRSKEKSDSIDGSQDVVVNVEFTNVSTGIYLDVTATITVVYPDDSTQIYPNLVGGVIHPIRCKQITDLGVATQIIACWN